MALQWVKEKNLYLCLSSDISGTTLNGVYWVGAKVFSTNTGSWYIVTGQNAVAPLTNPTGGITFSGSLPSGDSTVGAVKIRDDVDNTANVSGDGQLWVRARELSSFATRSIFYSTIPSDGQVQTIGDGSTSVTFEFDSSNDGVGGGNTAVVFDPEDDIAGMVAAIVPLINTSGLNIVATSTVDGYLLTSTIVGSGGIINVTGPADVATIYDLEPGLDEVSLRTQQELMESAVQYAPVGSHSSGTDISSATTLTKPVGAKQIMIQALTKNVRYTLDSTSPTASVGFQLVAGNSPVIIAVPGNSIKVIQEAATASLQYQWLS
jgi:hypothetical protein